MDLVCQRRFLVLLPCSEPLCPTTQEGCWLHLALPDLPHHRTGKASAPHFSHHPKGMAGLSHGTHRGRTCCFCVGSFCQAAHGSHGSSLPSCLHLRGLEEEKLEKEKKKSLGDSEEQGSLLEGKQTGQTNSRKAGERKGEISSRCVHRANPA